MDNQVTEQATEAVGDVPTSEQEGQVPFTPEAPKPEVNESTAEKPEPKPDNKDAKEWRKSDKEWQKAQEKAKIVDKLIDTLGIKAEEAEKPEDINEKLQREIADLREETTRAKWEAKHPAVDAEGTREIWEKAIKEKGHLIRSGDLSYDDLWKMVKPDAPYSTTSRDLKDQELRVGSVPSVSKSAPHAGDIDPEVTSLLKQAGYSDSQIKASA